MDSFDLFGLFVIIFLLFGIFYSYNNKVDVERESLEMAHQSDAHKALCLKSGMKYHSSIGDKAICYIKSPCKIDVKTDS